MEWILSIIAFILLLVFNYIYKRDKASIEEQYKEEISKLKRKHSEERQEWSDRTFHYIDETNKYRKLYSISLIKETFECSTEEAEEIFKMLDVQSISVHYLAMFLDAESKEQRIQIYQKLKNRSNFNH